MTVARIRNLHYAYPLLVPGQDESWVLRGIDLDVAEAEFLAIMGPTGSGKTTLCMSLNGLVPQATGGVIRGQVEVLGREARQTPVAELAAQVSIVYQDPESQLFSTTVLDEVAFGPENLGLPPDEIVRRVDWALDMVAMRELAGRSPTELSGGQKQRVAIAASLAMFPKLLVLDEPTANLDPVGRRQVFEVIARLCRERNTTIVLVSHDAEHVAEFADRVAILDEGRIQAVGAPNKVFGDAELIARSGLAAPQVTQVAMALRDILPELPMTLEDCASLLRANLASRARPTELDATEDGSGSHSREPIISIRNLSYHYNPETDLPIPALDGIDLDIPRGAFVGIVGANGSGKTTLVKHLNGLLKPTKGRVTVRGTDTRRASVSELARVVGHVFQNPDHQIFCTTVADELRFGPSNQGLSGLEIEERVQDALDRFSLSRYAEVPPALLGYGLRRLVSIAAVYAMRPEVLVLDEPAGGLDWRLTSELMAVVDALHREGHTILLVSHDMRLIAEHAKHLVVMRSGSILAQGPTQRLLADENLLREAQLEAPPVTRLSARLADLGMPRDVLSVDAFVTAYRQLRQDVEARP